MLLAGGPAGWLLGSLRTEIESLQPGDWTLLRPQSLAAALEGQSAAGVLPACGSGLQRIATDWNPYRTENLQLEACSWKLAVGSLQLEACSLEAWGWLASWLASCWAGWLAGWWMVGGEW